MRTACMLLAFCACAAVRALQAQPGAAGGAAAVPAAAVPATERAAALEAAAVDPTLKSTGRGTASAVSFHFASEDKTATAQIGAALDSLSRWALTVSGPLAKEGRTTLATGEGLNGGFNAELLVRRVFLSNLPQLPQAQLNSLCRRHLRRPEPGGGVPNPCVRKNLTAAGQALFDASFRPVWVVGGSLKAGRSTFDFTDPSTFNDHSEIHAGWSASASVGRFQTGGLSTLLYYVNASFRHEEAYEGGTERNICTPLGTSTSVFCRDIAVGAPQRKSADLVQVETRSFLGESVGLAPHATLDLNDSAWFVDVPIYLRDVEGPFNGGVSIGWDSRSDRVTVGLFVGALPRLLQ